ncbi:alpha/beta hydrolase [Hymenobacter qilianensis]|uniref:Alpha/beta hydrolase n=1 Tax=Hymenobacter qilianensis TaxID=1385715 RepID=A0ACB5PME6_9BACT|nr:alpha/beta hydrolase [Hymenobacter qilianensis]GGF52971.1 alpha/beta hydrolase [Hymenobacter qilianensis]
MIEAYKKPVIIFLHGFAESRNIWAEFTQDYPPEYRILTPNFPGYGNQKEPPVADYSMEALAEFVQEELDQTGIQQAIFIGHSMGGYVALAFAEKYPARVAGLCLFHSSAQADSEEKKANRDKNISFVERHGVAKFMETFIRPLFANANEEAMMPYRRQLEEIGAATSQASIVGGMRAMRNRPDRTEVLRKATFPVLFIVGKEDAAVPLATSLEQVALPPVSTALFLERVGHVGFFERPQVTRRAVLDFVGGIFGT